MASAESKGTHLFGFSPEFSSRYELTDIIAKTSWSTVFSGRDKLLDRKIAIKVLTQGGQADEKISNRFHNEAKSISVLDHPNIVKIFAYGWDTAAGPYIAMEFLSGQTLSVVLKEEKLFNAKKFEDTFIPVLDALCFAHEKKIVHRDIKPENIIITDEGSIKVLDFGISKPISQNQSQTVTSGLLGTPLYMSPEQCEGKDITSSTDIYSLACTMYETLSGRPPFFGESPAQTMYAHLHKTAPRLIDISSHRKVPVRLAEVIMQGLSKKPSKRPESMEKFRAQIQAALTGRALLQRNTKAKRLLKLLYIVGILLLITVALLSLKAREQYVARQKKLIMEGGTSPFRQSDVKRAKVDSILSSIVLKAADLRKHGKNQEVVDLLSSNESLVSLSDSKKAKFMFYYFLAQCNASLDKKENSIEYCKRSLECRGLEKELYYLQMADILAEQLTRSEQLAKAEEAIRVCNKVLAQRLKHKSDFDFMYGVLMVRKGEALSRLSRPHEAAESMREALALYDNCPFKRTYPYAALASLWLTDYAEQYPNKKQRDDEDQLKETTKQLLSSYLCAPDAGNGMRYLAKYYASKNQRKLERDLFTRVLSNHRDTLSTQDIESIERKLSDLSH
ncbi:MAG: protein kinase [Candidatus Obscuribacterales bacterium]|jgi:serine/threonine protein kinase|nr:protein kinase [Candidatus Obscuribacterales bacterium]